MSYEDTCVENLAKYQDANALTHTANSLPFLLRYAADLFGPFGQ